MKPQLAFAFSKLDKKPNLYSLLELQPYSTQDQVSYNYHRLIKKYNPDGSSDPQGYARILNEAYIILSNEKLRAKYDQENGFKDSKKVQGDTERVEENSKRIIEKQLK